MLPNASEPLLDLRVEPSRRLLLLVTGLHLLGIYSVVLLPLAVHWQILLTLPVWLSGVVHWFRLNRPPAMNRIRWQGPDRIHLRLDGTECGGALSGVHCLHPWLLSFSLRADHGGRHTCLLLPDQLDADSFRRLSARLRFARFVSNDQA